MEGEVDKNEKQKETEQELNGLGGPGAVKQGMKSTCSGQRQDVVDAPHIVLLLTIRHNSTHSFYISEMLI